MLAFFIWLRRRLWWAEWLCGAEVDNAGLQPLVLCQERCPTYIVPKSWYQNHHIGAHRRRTWTTINLDSVYTTFKWGGNVAFATRILGRSSKYWSVHRQLCSVWHVPSCGTVGWLRSYLAWSTHCHAGHVESITENSASESTGVLLLNYLSRKSDWWPSRFHCVWLVPRIHHPMHKNAMESRRSSLGPTVLSEQAWGINKSPTRNATGQK